MLYRRSQKNQSLLPVIILILILILILLLIIIISGASAREKRAWDRAPYSWNMVNLFSFVVTWLTERTYVRTYASTDCTGGVRETIKKEGRGVSGVVFASPHLLYRTLSIWSIDSCQNRIATDQYPMTISRAHVSTHRSDVICLETVRWPVNCFTRSRTMFNLILFSWFGIGTQENWYTYWATMLWSIDGCQNKVSADQYHLSVSRAQVSTHRGQVFFEVIRWQGTGFQMIAGSSLFFVVLIHMKYVVFMCRTIKILISNWPRTRKFSQLL